MDATPTVVLTNDPATTKENVYEEDENSDDEFIGQDVNKRYLKIPTYTRNFPHIVSRQVGYKGFLHHVAQLNGGVLPFATRRLVEEAWSDLLYEKYKEWETIHSDTIKIPALKNGLAQINTSLYIQFSQSKDETPMPLDQAGQTSEPLPSQPTNSQFPLHPSRDWRIVEIPAKLRELTRARMEEGKNKRKRPPPKSRKKAVPDEEDGEDRDYDTSSTVKPDKPYKRGPYKKRAKVTDMGEKSKNTENVIEGEYDQ